MHVHASPGNAATSRVLRISLLVTLAYIVLLVIAGIKAHSLALLSEAGHNLSDFFALLLSWGAVYLSGRSPNARKTFGYNRAGVLAAFVNGLTLVLVSFYIWYEAFNRLLNPVDVQPRLMIWVAAAGVIMNGGIALLLMRGHHDINLRSALLHEIGDTLSTAAVIIGGIAIALTGQPLDRPGPLRRNRRDDPVVVHRNHSREPQHPAGRHPARHGTRPHRSPASAPFPA